MGHSENYQKIYDYYNRYHFWTKKQVRNAVVKGIITADEYYEITGELY